MDLKTNILPYEIEVSELKPGNSFVDKSRLKLEDFTPLIDAEGDVVALVPHRNLSVWLEFLNSPDERWISG